MKGHTPWISKSHPAVAAVMCPYCDADVGQPCKPPADSKRAQSPLGRIGTHVARVRSYDEWLAQQIPTELAIAANSSR